MRYIPVYESLTFNGRSSLEFGVRISGSGTYKSPERDIEIIEVPGRNGTLSNDNGRYRNVSESYEAFIARDIEARLNEFRDFISKDTQYHRLEDSYHPDEYRMARFIGPIDPDVYFNESGRFVLTFDRAPQRWLKEGEQIYTVSSSKTLKLYNPTLQIALPKIKVTSGTGQITVNDVIVNVNQNFGSTIIDSELQDCYEDATNRNGDVELLTRKREYPTLLPGENLISVSNGMTIEIIPRWWRL